MSARVIRLKYNYTFSNNLAQLKKCNENKWGRRIPLLVGISWNLSSLTITMANSQWQCFIANQNLECHCQCHHWQIVSDDKFHEVPPKSRVLFCMEISVHFHWHDCSIYIVLMAWFHCSLQVPSMSARAVHLASIFLRGVAMGCAVNSTCCLPFKMDALLPWRMFDGKLFHIKYLAAESGQSPAQLCDNRVSRASTPPPITHPLSPTANKLCSYFEFQTVDYLFIYLLTYLLIN